MFISKQIFLTLSGLIVLNMAAASFATSGTSATVAPAGAEKKIPIQFIADSAITDKVKSEILANKNINNVSVSVATEKGVVTLSGKVESEIQKAEVIKVTSHIAGVKSVIDQLTISQL